MEVIFWAIIGYVVFATSMTIVVFYSDRKDYNDGFCPKCGHPWRCFDIDSQGGRGYWCDKCGNVIWVNFPVDKVKGEKND